MFYFEYGMRLRGFSPGAQPKEGFVRAYDDPEHEYHDILIYSRELSKKEIADYELDFIGALTGKDLEEMEV